MIIIINLALLQIPNIIYIIICSVINNIACAATRAYITHSKQNVSEGRQCIISLCHTYQEKYISFKMHAMKVHEIAHHGRVIKSRLVHANKLLPSQFRCSQKL